MFFVKLTTAFRDYLEPIQNRRSHDFIVRGAHATERFVLRLSASTDKYSIATGPYGEETIAVDEMSSVHNISLSLSIERNQPFTRRGDKNSKDLRRGVNR